jgi:hypothetical protein
LTFPTVETLTVESENLFGKLENLEGVTFKNLNDLSESRLVTLLSGQKKQESQDKRMGKDDHNITSRTGRGTGNLGTRVLGKVR